MASIADAVVAAVQAGVPGRVVSDGQVLTQPPPAGHVVVFCPEGDVDLENLAVAVGGKSVLVTVHSFGPTRQAAGWLSRHVTDYLLSSGVDVPGWGHGDVAEHHNDPPVSDDSVKEFPVVMFHDQFRLLFAKTD